jgi:dihydroorotase
MILHSKAGAHGSLTIQGARVLDPGAGVDALLDLKIEKGIISELAQPSGKKSAGKSIAAEGLVLAPAFVDPHVHLRTPGREDEETIASGSAAAASGGYCAILAMPNTSPTVDNAAVLGALVEQAQKEAVVPTGFMAAISRGLAGEELTEMGELAAAGAAAFTDDGQPVCSAGMMRRALQYAGSTGRRLAMHCEEPSLSRRGQMHEGAVSAELGLAGWPAVAESVAVARNIALAAYEEQPLHLMHLSTSESVELVRRALVDGVQVSAEVTPHHLCLTDEAVRSLDSNLKMNPPLGSERDRLALIEALKSGAISCIATDHAPHARQEKDVPFEVAPFGVTGLETAFAALYTHLVERGLLSLETLLDRMSVGPAHVFDLPVPRIAVGEPANLVLLDLEASWLVREERFRSLSVNSWLLGQVLRGEVVLTIAAGHVVFGSERVVA